MAGARLKSVSTSAIECLRQAIYSGQLKAPVDRAGLLGCGIRHQLEEIEAALQGHRSPACIAILDVTLAEREDRKPSPELVWTGPDMAGGTARDTAVVLREPFEGARESVVLAGYDFDHAQDLLAPLHASMRDHGVRATFFVHIDQPQRREQEDGHLARQLGGFFTKIWPFGDPRPRVFYDKRALKARRPWSSLHAKCLVVDGATAFVSSANFTQRGHDRNIEVGVLIADPSFATRLAGQWLGLIEAGLVWRSLSFVDTDHAAIAEE